MLRNADLAMYRAKGEGKGSYALYEPAMHELVLERLELEADLQRAVLADEFDVHYQPIVTLQNGGIVGVEALVRWKHPERGLVLPATSSRSPRRPGSSSRSVVTCSMRHAVRQRSGASAATRRSVSA